MVKDDGIWFEPKSHGIGAGVPVAWQGWALIAAYSVLVIGLIPALMPRHPLAFYASVAAATIALMVIAARHTRGGWRWRWGGD